jgi:phage terminase large subunit
MNSDEIKISEKFQPLFDIPKGVDVFILTGGRYSQKSFAVSMSSIMSCKNYGHRILYSRYTNASLKDSIYAEVEEKINMLNVNAYFNLTINRIDALFNNSKIVFKGLKAGSNQQTANLKGLKDFSFWILDEAEELLDENIYDKIFLSIRGNNKNDKNANIKVMILNPATKEHFIYKKYFESKGVKEGFNGVKDNVCYIHTTYLDCIDFVPKEIQGYFEDMKNNNPHKYNHVVLGGWLDKAEGVVFTNWKYGEFNPDNLQTSFGQDYGFSIDPTTLIEVAIDKKKKIIYCKEHLYKTNLRPHEIAHINNQYAKGKLIIADNSAPMLINELVLLGNRVIGPRKIEIQSGISLMQDYNLIIDTESLNIGKELNNYVYTDKGSKLYCDMWNHALDAIRYNVTYNLSGGYNFDIR